MNQNIKIKSPDKNEVSVSTSFYREKEAADFLNLSPRFLQKMRLVGGGPNYQKFGASVRYSEADLLEYIAACTRSSTSDQRK